MHHQKVFIRKKKNSILGFLLLEDNIKFLVSQGLSRLFLPPYAYALDLWRWSVYNGSIQPHEYNKRYWDLM
jgi:hypothetical protein